MLDIGDGLAFHPALRGFADLLEAGPRILPQLLTEGLIIDAAIAQNDAQKAAFIDPVTTTLLAQTPVTAEARERKIQEFENIKAGF